MTVRICPDCGVRLFSHDHFFCSSCQSELPKKSISPPVPVKLRARVAERPAKVRDVFSVAVFKNLFGNKRILLSVGLIIFIVSVFTVVLKSGIVELALIRMRRNERVAELFGTFSKMVRKEIDVDVGMPASSFSKYRFTDYVPSDADLYFVASSFEHSSKYLIGDVFTDDFVNKAKLLLESEYAGFSYSVGDENRWAFIFVPKDVGLVKTVMEIMTHDYWNFTVIGDYFVMANNTDMFKRMEESKNRLTQSLSLNPRFVRKEKELADRGRLLVVLMSNSGEDIVNESLGGISSDGVAIVDEIMNKGYDYFVVGAERE